MRVRSRVMAAVALLAVGMAVVAPSAGGGQVVVNGRIAYDANIGAEPYHIYTVNPDGSDPVQLTTLGDNQNPAWSPDGTRIAFDSSRDGNRAVFVMNADGSNQQRLTDPASTSGNPAWSPDGTMIAFNSDADGPTQIFVMGADGSDPTNISQSAEDEVSPTWSPDGSMLAFVSGFQPGIWVMDADGSNEVRLTPVSMGESLHPDWSPDGSRIAFDNCCDQGAVVMVMDPDGSNVVNLSNNDFINDEPTWSPDGTQIAFTSYVSQVPGGGRTDTGELFVMDADGSNQLPITSNGGWNYTNQDGWQPLFQTPTTPTTVPPTTAPAAAAVAPAFTG